MKANGKPILWKRDDLDLHAFHCIIPAGVDTLEVALDYLGAAKDAGGGLGASAPCMTPQLAIVNPPLWEIGHVAWFQEWWVLRHALGAAPLIKNGDALYDSSAIPHDSRWELPLPADMVSLLERLRK